MSEDRSCIGTASRTRQRSVRDDLLPTFCNSLLNRFIPHVRSPMIRAAPREGTQNVSRHGEASELSTVRKRRVLLKSLVHFRVGTYKTHSPRLRIVIRNDSRRRSRSSLCGSSLPLVNALFGTLPLSRTPRHYQYSRSKFVSVHSVETADRYGPL